MPTMVMRSRRAFTSRAIVAIFFASGASCANPRIPPITAPLPSVPAAVEWNASGPVAGVVGLAPAVDARENLVVGLRSIEAGLVYIKPGELEPFVRSQAGKHLAEKGFQVVAVSLSAPPSPPRRTVVFTVLSAKHNTMEPMEMSVKLKEANAEISVRVLDPAGREIFVRSYIGEVSGTGLGRAFSHFPFPRQPEEVEVEAVTDAIDDALAKACDDTAFIAAIAPPQQTSPLTPR